MKILKGINFGEIAMSAAGNAAGLAVVTQLNRVPFIAKQTNPKIKGLITLLAGKVVLPMLAKSAGFAGKKTGGLVAGASEAMAVYGIAQIGNDVAPNIFPKVSGIDGYEDNPLRNMAGMGLVTNEDGMNGVDEDQVNREI
jgi:hypothetical protein